MIKWKLVAASGVFLVAAGADASQPPPPDLRAPPRLVAGSITNADYPSAAIRAGEHGTVRIQIGVSADGAVTGCEILESSGSQALDTQSCVIAAMRFRFEPGRDIRGEAAASTYRQSVRWVMPDYSENERLPVVDFTIAITATIRDGQILSCAGQSAGFDIQPHPIEICRLTFEGHEVWAPLRAQLSSATHVVALRPQGAAPFVPNQEWGALRFRLDSDLVFGPDGRLISCQFPIPGQTNAASCLTDMQDKLRFSPASDPERQARMTVALFGVSGR